MTASIEIDTPDGPALGSPNLGGKPTRTVPNEARVYDATLCTRWGERSREEGSPSKRGEVGEW